MTKEYRLDISIRFGSIHNLFSAVTMLFNAFISKNSFHYESGEVQEILTRMTQSLNNTAVQGSGDSVGGIMADKEIKFNKTRLKSLSEMACFQKEFKVKQILPMVEIDGLLYITNARLYF